MRIVPEPAPQGALEPSEPVRSDANGEFEVDLDLTEDDVDTGSFTLEVVSAEDAEAEGDALIGTDLEIAETCTM